MAGKNGIVLEWGGEINPFLPCPVGNLTSCGQSFNHRSMAPNPMINEMSRLWKKANDSSISTKDKFDTMVELLGKYDAYTKNGGKSEDLPKEIANKKTLNAYTLSLGNMLLSDIRLTLNKTDVTSKEKFNLMNASDQLIERINGLGLQDKDVTYQHLGFLNEAAYVFQKFTFATIAARVDGEKLMNSFIPKQPMPVGIAP